ncbi:M24 family metallopeptidase [Clostridium rectalis]|uniref:M24 family metallopeptidase n=1 Tax=Clostridium rectalis TaxID=2040295 RepID=UPI000F63DBC0|nr:aminopeptidase P family protein [Clostridium rectalis]
MKNFRLNKTLETMKENNINQIIISDPASIFYLTGQWIYPGERMLVLYLNTNGQHKLFINELFPTSENLDLEQIRFKDTDDAVEILCKHIDKKGIIGIDKNWPAKFLLKLIELNKESEYVNASVIIDRIRMCKDYEEKNLMREASRINDMAMEEIIKIIPKKYSEKKLGEKLLNIYESLGAEGYSFDPILAYGKNTSDPHHEIDNTILKEGEGIIIDIGCRFNSYCSDMTRTVFYKSVSDNAKKIYNIVLEANKRAINSVKPGVRFCDIDKVAREYIESFGYGKYFTHRTGHSIGIDVHDLGDVSSTNIDILKPGMIFSVEPGIYLPNEVGVRIEDLVLVTDNGCEILNSYNKELTVIK